ncbi:MAG: hypothetical protein NTW21_05430 [Verrucomicrobia bacterium]|nr:hypothetical protein [Verrucomicrobiota bacterium]
MDFDSWLDLTGTQPSFELALLVQAFGGAGGHPGSTFAVQPTAFPKVIPRHQSAIRRERLAAATKMKLAARRQEFEIQVPITHWVSRFIACYCLQTAQLSALALLIRNPNCGL